MLNSAVGVTLPPSKKPPPISTICLIRPAILGSRISASAMLVSGPSAHSVTVPLGSCISVSTMKSTAYCFCSGIFGSGRSGPSRPVLPCTSSAVTSGRTSGRIAPAKTLVSGLPASSQILRAFFSVSFRGNIARDGGDPQHVQLGTCQRQQDGDAHRPVPGRCR